MGSTSVQRMKRQCVTYSLNEKLLNDNWKKDQSTLWIMKVLNVSLINTRQTQLLYCHLLIHAEIYIYMLDTYWRNELIRRKHDNDKDAGRKTQEAFFNNILPLTLLQGFERVVQGLHVRRSWRSNITAIFWPHCYDRHVVSLSFFSAAQPKA